MKKMVYSPVMRCVVAPVLGSQVMAMSVDVAIDLVIDNDLFKVVGSWIVSIITTYIIYKKSNRK